jgi:hypothetical protein
MRAWRRGRLSQAARYGLAGTALCEVCGYPEHEWNRIPPALYADLLGVYLGDGCLTAVGRTWSLRSRWTGRIPGSSPSYAARCRRSEANQGASSRR